MNKSRFLALSFLLAISGFGTAYAQAPALAAGSYKLAIGTKTPCAVTLAADGTLTAGTDCSTGVALTKWAPTATGYQLISASGETYALLKPHGEALEGSTFADQRKVTLSH
ncbi:MAG TPA: hypothetical protein VG387_13290 [Rhizomicrobium sp.]|jgi:hypothetical protein|nr:hypothetical protein [Rhizomicrobium sp.]